MHVHTYQWYCARTGTSIEYLQNRRVERTHAQREHQLHVRAEDLVVRPEVRLRAALSPFHDVVAADDGDAGGGRVWLRVC